jgi:hypothetical protein
LIYYTCDVNICVEMDPGTHMVCAWFYPLEPGVTCLQSVSKERQDFLGLVNKEVI